MRWIASWVCYYIGHWSFLIGELIPDSRTDFAEYPKTATDYTSWFFARAYQKFMSLSVRAQGYNPSGPWRSS